MCNPIEGDYENAAEIYVNAFDNGDTEDLGFVFDGRSVEQEIISVTFVIQNEFSKLLIADDFDLEIQKLEQSLNKAGLDKIIDECKKQYSEWKTGDENEQKN